ncbi:putative bifunctional diguanylate cyclase/phosphodiesterase [Kineococcus sp. GCM10028916]|uniref:putative bifunctional diguanylate cyclase/phosphodiesterase n=1 Tax=Kineococcus sp. GCM10028916 TaxID=3273394 RepID=UPI00363169D2
MGDTVVTVVALARTTVIAASFAALTLRVRRPAGERSVWRSYQFGVGTLLLGSALDTVVRAGGIRSPVTGVALVACAQTTCFFLYRALLHWNRQRTSTSGTGRADWLLGVGSTAAFTGILLTAAASAGHRAGAFATQLHAFHLSALLVLLVSYLVVMISAQAVRNARGWVVVASVAVVLAGQAHLALHPSETTQVLASLSWAGLAATLGGCALLHPSPKGPSVPSPLSLAVSAFGALGLGLVTAFAALSVPGARAALVWAGLAMLLACVRLFRFVGEITAQDRDRRDARTDELTGLGNRRAFTAAVEEACAGEAPIAVALLDLDRFKEVNDHHGHGVGDRLLQVAAVRLQELTPPRGLLTRLGGDEFAVVLTGADAAAALRTARTFAAAIGGGLIVEGRSFDVGASVGVATSTGLDDLDGLELLRRADAAMYVAKGGGGGVTLHDDEIDRLWRGRADLAEDLHAAFECPTVLPFEVHYQPQLCLRSGEVVGVEALVRWQHPRHGLLAPAAFLSIVEERGLMPALTSHVARTASADLARWRAAGLDLRLSINTSTTYLSDPQLLEVLDEVVRSGTAPSRLVVEVTETTLMRDPERALAMCHEITARGCALSIDDFGTGYSSLAYLANLPATELKIDRSFTMRALTDVRIAAIVAGTVELAHHLGLRTVAEGVEDEGTLELLRRTGCDESQGYLHSRPVPAAELLRWVMDRRRAAAVAVV